MNEVQLVNTEKIGLILAIAPDGPPQPGEREVWMLLLQGLRLAQITILQDYFTWCAIGSHNHIARVDIRDCDMDFMILRAIEEQSGYMDIKGSTLWKVSIPRDISMSTNGWFP